MKLPIYQVDAFADREFSGNPAAVCPLPVWLSDAKMQAIATENNVSETAFFAPARMTGIDFELRWFTPTVEVPLCGHATLASGYVLIEELGYHKNRVVFGTRTGLLSVEKRGELFWVDLPASPPQPLGDAAPADLLQGLGKRPSELLVAANKYLAVYDSASTITGLVPDMSALARLEGMGVAITAPGASHGVDFVSRYFNPACGVPEDPVTGAAHCLLVPYWAQRLGRSRMEALQLSARGGRLMTTLLGERVALGGRVQPFLRGEVVID